MKTSVWFMVIRAHKTYIIIQENIIIFILDWTWLNYITYKTIFRIACVQSVERSNQYLVLVFSYLVFSFFIFFFFGYGKGEYLLKSHWYIIQHISLCFPEYRWPHLGSDTWSILTFGITKAWHLLPNQCWCSIILNISYFPFLTTCHLWEIGN